MKRMKHVSCRQALSLKLRWMYGHTTSSYLTLWALASKLFLCNNLRGECFVCGERVDERRPMSCLSRVKTSVLRIEKERNQASEKKRGQEI